MAKKVFTVAEAPDSKRTSDRDYTHALIGQVDFDYAIAATKKAWAQDSPEKGSFNYMHILASATAGESYGKYKAGYRFTIDQDMIDKGKEFAAAYPTHTIYVEKSLEAALKIHNERRAANEGKWVVLRWSQSAANASKGFSEFCGTYKNVRCVETMRVK